MKQSMSWLRITLALVCVCMGETGWAKEVLLHSGDYPNSIQWSPDSRRVAFAVYDENERAMTWVVERDGSWRRMLAEGAPVCWTGDGQCLFIVENPCNSPVKYYRINVETGVRGPVLEIAEGCFFMMSRLPDQDRYLIVTARCVDNGPTTCDVLATDAEGRIAKVLLKDLPDSELNPTWASVSPDGKWLGYTSYKPEGDQVAIYIMNMATGEKRMVEEYEMNLSPVWAPDSRHIAYAHRCYEMGPGLPGGAPPQGLLEEPDTNAPERGGSGNDGMGLLRLIIVDITSGEKRDLGEITGDPDLYRWATLAFAGKGQYLLHRHSRAKQGGGNLHLFLRSLNQSQSEYFVVAACERALSSPDESAVAFLRDRSLWCAEVDWNHLETLDDRVKRLTKDLSGANREAQEWAARELGWIAHPQSVPSLIKALSYSDPTTRALAANALGKIGGKNSAEAIARLLHDPSHEVRREAAMALGKLGDRRAVLPLCGLLLASNADVQYEIIELLKPMQDPRSIVAFAALAEREKYGPSAGPIAQALQFNHHKDAIALAMRIFRQSKLPEVRSSAVNALARMTAKEAVPLLLRAFASDPDARVRRECAGALGQLKAKEALAPLLKAAKSPDAEMRGRVAVALTFLGDPKGLPTVLALAKDPNPEVRLAVVRLLDRWEHKRVIPVLRELAKDPDPRVRDLAEEVLPIVGDRPVLTESLLEKLRNRDRVVRGKAVAVLDKTGDKRAAAALLPLLNDPEEDVRREVWDALYHLPMDPFPTEEERKRIASEPDPWQSLSVEAKLSKTDMVVGAVTPLTLILRNIGDKALPVPCQTARFWEPDENQWDVEAWPDKSAVPDIPRGKAVSPKFVSVNFNLNLYSSRNAETLRARAAYVQRTPLLPGQTVTFDFPDLVTSLSWRSMEAPPLSIPGQYSVRAAFNPRPYLIGSDKSWIASQPIPLRIHPLPSGVAVAYLASRRPRGELRWARRVKGQRGDWVKEIAVRTTDGDTMHLSCDAIRRIDIDNARAAPPPGFSHPYHIEKSDGSSFVANISLDYQPFILVRDKWRALPLPNPAGEPREDECVQAIILGR